MHITTFQEANALLESLYAGAKKRGVTYTPERIRQLLEFLDNPQEKMRVVHVAGTSGKTSTCYYTAALLHAAGKRVGHTVSPHLYALNERVQLDMVPMPEAVFCSELTIFLTLVEQSHVEPTFFELMVAFAFWVFARNGVEYAVVEVGLGGLLDATNVVRRPDKVCVITDIGLDHQNVLGRTLREITEHKAGIIQLKNAVFCYKQSADIMDAITRRCAQKQADLHTFRSPHLPERFHFLPHYQQRNFSLAWRTVHFIGARDGFELSEAAQKCAARISIPGRMETVTLANKKVILDGAHNPQKLQALAETLRQEYPGQTIAVLIGFIKSGADRLEPSTAEIATFADHIIVTQPVPEPAYRQFEDPGLIAALCKTHGSWSVEERPELAAALKLLVARPEKVLVATGSLHLLSAIRKYISGVHA